MEHLFSFPFELQNEYIFDLTINSETLSANNYKNITDPIVIEKGKLFNSDMKIEYSIHHLGGMPSSPSKGFSTISDLNNIRISVPGTSTIYISHTLPYKGMNHDLVGSLDGTQSVMINYANQSVLVRYSSDYRGKEVSCKLKIDKYGTLHIDTSDQADKKMAELIHIPRLSMTKPKYVYD